MNDVQRILEECGAKIQAQIQGMIEAEQIKESAVWQRIFQKYCPTANLEECAANARKAKNWTNYLFFIQEIDRRGSADIKN